MSVGARDREYALQPVPLAARLPLIAVILLWASLTLDPSAPYLAMEWGMKFSFLTLLIATLTANIVLSIFSSLSAYIASKEGLTYALAARNVFGDRGVVVPALWAGVVSVGWLAFSIGVVVDAIIAYTGLPSITYYILVIIFTLLFSTTAYLGVKHIVKLAWIGVPLLIILIIAGATLSLTIHGPLEIGGFDLASYAFLTSLILGTFVNGSITLSFDYQRFAKTPRDAIVTAFTNFLFFWSFIILLGAIPAAVLHKDLITSYIYLGLAPLGVIALFLLAWTSADNQLYSASLSWTLAVNKFGKNIDRKKIVLTAAILTIVLALIKLHTFAVQWLVLMTTIALPVGVILWSDYYIIRRLTRDDWGLGRTINWKAFLTWFIGSLLIYYLNYILQLWYGLLLCFLAIAVLYIVLARIKP